MFFTHITSQPAPYICFAPMMIKMQFFEFLKNKINEINMKKKINKTDLIMKISHKYFKINNK